LLAIIFITYFDSPRSASLGAIEGGSLSLILFYGIPVRDIPPRSLAYTPDSRRRRRRSASGGSAPSSSIFPQAPGWRSRHQHFLVDLLEIARPCW
jgi:hypothetical protein